LIATIICALASPLNAQRPGQADDMAAVDQPPSVLAGVRVEMHLGGVLPQPVASMCSASSMVTPSTWSMISPTA
jgi:hypothetical protein